MREQATRKMTVSGTPERCFAVVTDFESYPEWAADIKQVDVRERDGQGRGTSVAFRAAAFGRSTSYTLAYDYSQAPKSVSWSQAEGDVTRVLSGSYDFDAAGDGETEVTYRLDVELRIPIPGFVKRRAEGRIMHTAIEELKARVESGWADRGGAGRARGPN